MERAQKITLRKAIAFRLIMPFAVVVAIRSRIRFGINRIFPPLVALLKQRDENESLNFARLGIRYGVLDSLRNEEARKFERGVNSIAISEKQFGFSKNSIVLFKRRQCCLNLNLKASKNRS